MLKEYQGTGVGGENKYLNYRISTSTLCCQSWHAQDIEKEAFEKLTKTVCIILLLPLFFR